MTANAYMVADNRMAQLALDDEAALVVLLGDFDTASTTPSASTKPTWMRSWAVTRRADHSSGFDTSDVHDQFWMTAHGPIQQQAEALRRIRQLMADLPGVQVRIGTINLDEP